MEMIQPVSPNRLWNMISNNHINTHTYRDGFYAFEADKTESNSQDIPDNAPKKTPVDQEKSSNKPAPKHPTAPKQSGGDDSFDLNLENLFG